MNHIVIPISELKFVTDHPNETASVTDTTAIAVVNGDLHIITGDFKELKSQTGLHEAIMRLI